MESLENIEVASVANLSVPADVDESFATEMEVVQQAHEPVAGSGVDPLRAEARDSGVAGAWCQGCPKVT